MRSIAQALIARTTGKAFPDQSTLPRDQSFHNIARRNAAAQRYIDAIAYQRAMQRQRTAMLCLYYVAGVAAIAYALTLPNAAAGLTLFALGAASLYTAILPPRG